MSARDRLLWGDGRIKRCNCGGFGGNWHRLGAKYCQHQERPPVEIKMPEVVVLPFPLAAAGGHLSRSEETDA